MRVPEIVLVIALLPTLSAFKIAPLPCVFHSVTSCGDCGSSKPTHRFDTNLCGSKWDNLVDEDDPEVPIPPDMKYVPRNIIRQNSAFFDIREAGGKEMTNDIYVRKPKSEEFWFAGKVARISDVTVEQAVARQWYLIQQHAANLRPLDLFPSRDILEIWSAPGDSEMEVAYNKRSLAFQKMEKEVEGASGVTRSSVGFQGEMYQSGEEGFRTWRSDDGMPLKPEIHPGAGATPAGSEEDVERLVKTIEGMDVNKLYQEQERREGREVTD